MSPAARSAEPRPPAGGSDPTDRRGLLSQVSFAAAVEARCSVRRFLPEPVPREHVEAMVALAVRAANASNSQPWRFVVVEDEGLRHETAEAVHAALDVMAGLPECAGRTRDIRAIRAYATFFVDAPVVVAVFALPYASRSDELLAARGMSAEERDRMRQRPAHTMGYGSCWMTAPVLAAPAIEEILTAPAGARLVALVPIGLPAGRLRHSQRLPLDDVLSWR
jgi:nitroreductase